MRKLYKTRIVVVCLALALASAAQAKEATKDTTVQTIGKIPEPHQVTLAVAAGFADPYRAGYTVPTRFEKSDVSGFAPVYARIEYAITKNTGIGATFSYDAFYAAYYQLYEVNGTPSTYKRNHTDKVTVFGAGLSLYYHLGSFLKVKRLDPYISAGFALNNITNQAKPQGDTITATKEHTVSPSIRIGARYYFTSIASLFADAGYDQQSYFSVGFSCRFLKKKK